MAPTPRLLSEITSNGEAAFPWKLHRVLEESERLGFGDIVSWQGNRAFKVHDPKNFEKTIMKKYFNQTRYKSFQRQLNIYGFERITAGTGIGSYTHQLLIRGKPNICRFMVRTKVKKKGSKAASTSINLSSNGSSRRASTIGTRGSITSSEIPQKTPQMIRSMSCPVTTASSKPSININGIANESFRIDASLTHCVSRDASRASRDVSLRSMPEEFSDDLFSNDAYDANGGALVSVDGMSNMTMNTGQRNDLPSMLVCEDNIQDDITDLGNSSRSHKTQASGMLFQQQAQSDPFQPEPIPEHQLPLQNQQHCQQQHQLQMMEQQIQQRMHQQRQEQECQMLQMQIQSLQNQIAQQRRGSSNNGNNSNYLCNGVAAIGPSDRGIVTLTTLSPNEETLCSGRNSIGNRLHEKNLQGFLLDPTPIYSPAIQPNASNGNMRTHGTDANMTRTISFGSFPQMI